MIEIRINFPEKKRNVCWLHVLYHHYLVTAAIQVANIVGKSQELRNYWLASCFVPIIAMLFSIIITTIIWRDEFFLL